jgi:hypothetical protein
LIELGTQAKYLQFIDLNRDEQVYKLPYAKQVTNCDEALRELKFLMNEGEKLKIKFRPAIDIEQFDQSLKHLASKTKTSE